MGVRENKVEVYLDREIRKLGGITRKWTGHAGIPDRIVLIDGTVVFVEVKTVDGRLSSVQKREHERLEGHGANVAIVYGNHGVDEFIYALKK